MSDSKADIERYYEVTHQESWRGGKSSINVAVTDETDTEIRGHRFKDSFDRGPRFMGKITVRKDNVAAWEEIRPIQEGKTTDAIKEDYVLGRIDEEELEEELEDRNGG